MTSPSRQDNATALKKISSSMRSRDLIFLETYSIAACPHVSRGERGVKSSKIVSQLSRVFSYVKIVRSC